jgi:uncharacterized protein YgbK (DUF1537 family)
VTAGQIDSACSDGFADIRVDAVALIDEQTRDGERERLKRAAGAALERGMSPLIYSARGPDDPAIARLRSFIDEQARSE